MQDRDLVVILTKNEEKGVHEFYEFGKVVPPEDTDNLGTKGSQFISITSLERLRRHDAHFIIKLGEPHWTLLPSSDSSGHCECL